MEIDNEMNDFEPSINPTNNHKINHTIEMIVALSNTMRQLSLCALDMQGLALSKKHQIEKKIDMVDDLGDIIDDLIHFLSRMVSEYIAEQGPCP